jgi:lipase
MLYGVTQRLHVHRYGPAGPAQVLAIHGLAGHGRRWEALATGELPDVTLLAPDLLGHGRSSWTAPWSIDANVGALAALLAESGQPAVVVGHSFGGAIAIHLANAHPDLVAALVLLDPAIGLDGEWMREIADAMFDSPDYTDAAEAREEKATGSWADVDPALLDADVAEHLIELPNGRVGWRISIPAMMSYWSELARDIVLPPNGIPVTLVRAGWTSPQYVSDTLIDGLRQHAGDGFILADLDCEHMVAQAKPAETARLIRQRLTA